MTDMLLYLALFSALTLLMAWMAKRDIRNRHNKKIEAAIADAHEEMDPKEAATRQLIGDEAYEKMVARVDEVIRRHQRDNCISVALTSGPDNEKGWKELNRILPGDPVWLKKSSHDGVDCVDVFSGGFRIGRLMLTAAGKVFDVLDNAIVTGSYVAEQNSWGDSNVVAMRIIIFHRPARENETVFDPLAEGIKAALYSVELKDGDRTLTFTQN